MSCYTKRDIFKNIRYLNWKFKIRIRHNNISFKKVNSLITEWLSNVQVLQQNIYCLVIIYVFLCMGKYVHILRTFRRFQ